MNLNLNLIIISYFFASILSIVKTISFIKDRLKKNKKFNKLEFFAYIFHVIIITLLFLITLLYFSGLSSYGKDNYSQYIIPICVFLLCSLLIGLKLLKSSMNILFIFILTFIISFIISLIVWKSLTGNISLNMVEYTKNNFIEVLCVVSMIKFLVFLILYLLNNDKIEDENVAKIEFLKRIFISYTFIGMYFFIKILN